MTTRAAGLTRDEILGRLDVVAFYSEYIPGFKTNGALNVACHCPFHEDRKASLSVNRESGLYMCHGCGAKGSPVDFLMAKLNIGPGQALSMLVDRANGGPPRPIAVKTPTNQERHRHASIPETRDGATKSAVYHYTLDGGTGVAVKVRYVYSDGTKTFRWFECDGDEFLETLGGRSADLYQLGAVRAGIARGATVLMNEGEKATDRANDHAGDDTWGYVATCGPNGADSFSKTEGDRLAAQLAGAREVAAVVDRDAKGARWHQRVRRHLEGRVESLRFVQSCVMTDKADLYDHLEAGHTLADLVPMVDPADATTAEANGSAAGHEAAPIRGAKDGEERPKTGGRETHDTPKPTDGVPEEPDWLADGPPSTGEPTETPVTNPTPGDWLGVEVGESEQDPADASVTLEDYTGPRLPESCLRLGFAEFRQAYSHTTEAPDEYYWSCFLSAAGMMMGRHGKLACGVEVYANTYIANVGPSGYRKDPPQQAQRRLMPSVDESVRIIRGVGSPEGLIEPFESNNGAASVRVLVDLNELSALLRKGKGEATSGLVPMLCTLYDCPPNYELRTRKKPILATEPFLSIIAATTSDWVQSDMSELDVRGGLAGRLIYMVGPPKPPVPFPPRWDVTALTEAERLLRKTRDRHGVVREYELTREARDLWASWYTAERAREYSNPLLGTIAKRLHTNAWKVALVFAGIEGTPEITAEQISAAIDFADYQRAAQAVVYEGFGDSKRVKTERRIVEAVRNHGPLANWQIRQRVRHVGAEELQRSIRALGSLGVIVPEHGKWIVRKRGR